MALLNSPDSKVQRAGAGALRTLAFKNEANKNLVLLHSLPLYLTQYFVASASLVLLQIVECGALPILIFMLRAEDPGIHYEAVLCFSSLLSRSVCLFT